MKLSADVVGFLELGQAASIPNAAWPQHDARSFGVDDEVTGLDIAQRRSNMLVSWRRLC
jgi:hypothetical protein